MGLSTFVFHLHVFRNVQDDVQSPGRKRPGCGAKMHPKGVTKADLDEKPIEPPALQMRPRARSSESRLIVRTGDGVLYASTRVVAPPPAVIILVQVFEPLRDTLTDSEPVLVHGQLVT